MLRGTLRFLDLPDEMLSTICNLLAAEDAFYFAEAVSGRQSLFCKMISTSNLMLVHTRLAKLVSETPISTLHFKCNSLDHSACPSMIWHLNRPVKVVWWEIHYCFHSQYEKMLIAWLSKYRWATKIRVLRIQLHNMCQGRLQKDQIAKLLPNTKIVYSML